MSKYIVIGAGILGASTAYHLAKAGKSVIVIDRKDAGQATDAAAGIICPWLSQRRNKAWYTLAKNGASYYENLIQQLEEDGETETGYKKLGAISLHEDEEKLVNMQNRALTRREDAPEIGHISQLSSTETRGLFPPLSAIFKSVHVSGAARVNGRALCQALKNAAQKYGAQFVHGSATLIGEKNKVMGVKVGDKQYDSDVVIATAGAWAKELLTPLGIHLQVNAQKAQIVHLQLRDQTDNWPVVMPPNNQYIVPFDGGQVVIGATYEDDQQFDLRATVGGMHEVFEKALHVAPGLAEGTYVETRVGFRPVAPNFLPIIGEVPTFEGLFLANGLGSSGLTVGPYLGKELANLVQKNPTEIDLDLYAVSTAIRE